VPIDSLLSSIVDTTCFSIDRCKFELLQKDQSRPHSIDSPKAYRKTSSFEFNNCRLKQSVCLTCLYTKVKRCWKWVCSSMKRRVLQTLWKACAHGVLLFDASFSKTGFLTCNLLTKIV